MSNYYNLTPENLTEFLVNTLNITSVFYDIFLNPEPMDVEVEQYDDNNELVKVVIPNRAKDRILSLIGSGDPNGVVEAPAGTMYIDASTAKIYVKVSGDDTNGWVPLITRDDIIDIVRDYLLDNDFVTVGYLEEHGYVTVYDIATHETPGVVMYDNSSITKNDKEQLQTVGVMDQNNDVNRLWVGLLADYEAITEKDDNTIYIVTDDSDEEPEPAEVVQTTEDEEEPIEEPEETEEP